jgi:hypothetical protein
MKLEDIVKELNENSRKKMERHQRNNDLKLLSVILFATIVSITALHLGFNICMKPTGDCTKEPNGLLFKSRIK